MESSTRGDVAPGLAAENGKTPADEDAEAGEVQQHSAHALGSTTTPHSKREKAAWQLVAANSMGSASNSMGKMPLPALPPMMHTVQLTWARSAPGRPKGPALALQCQPQGWHWSALGTPVPAAGWHWGALALQCH